MAPAETLPAFNVVLLDKRCSESRGTFQFTTHRVTLKNLDKLRRLGTAQKHFVLNAAQERLIAQAFRLKIGGEDEEGLERDRHFPAGLEAQIIDVPLHRNDPSIEDLGRTGLLTAEVIDEINAIVGLELEGRVVDFGVLVEAQIQHVQP